MVKAPPVVLPYSPEFRPSVPGEGLEGEPLLDRLAEETGGLPNRSMSGLFESWGVESRTRSSLAPFLALAALLLWVGEIALRRLQLAAHPIWGILALRLRPGRPSLPRAPVGAPVPEKPQAAPAPVPEPEAPKPRPAPPQGGGLSAALRKAKHRAGGKME